ncbi:hypothetical protein [cf. Phormidesmis sp. LEGE 11477]|uniref:hypothetical protein n=1 Tax=cf. Phormidesmis sp. LEGE 11477 TaxID=1828680 RepID=UPI001D13ABCF|nr:hypothetical protein [cf. Phormidesmis sp. LEGE 11477]
MVEAKNADISRGFTQLGVELIALDRLVSADVSTLYGIVTTGDTWKFGQLLRDQQKILRDTDIYGVPTDLERLLSVLMGIVQPLPVSV